MTSWTDQTKNTSTFAPMNISGIGLWGDPVVTWGNILYTWGSNITTWVDGARNSSSFTNLPKS